MKWENEKFDFKQFFSSFIRLSKGQLLSSDNKPALLSLNVTHFFFVSKSNRSPFKSRYQTANH